MPLITSTMQTQGQTFAFTVKLQAAFDKHAATADTGDTEATISFESFVTIVLQQ